MAGRAQVRVIGLRELRRDLKRLGDDSLNQLADAHDRAARIVADASRPRVPVVTGELRGTVRHSGTKTRGVVRAGYKRVPYAGPIHFGWPARNIRSQPFFYEAMDRRESQVIQTFRDHVSRIRRRNGL